MSETRSEQLEQALYEALLNIKMLMELCKYGELIIPEMQVELDLSIKLAKELLLRG